MDKKVSPVTFISYTLPKKIVNHFKAHNLGARVWHGSMGSIPKHPMTLYNRFILPYHIVHNMKSITIKQIAQKEKALAKRKYSDAQVIDKTIYQITKKIKYHQAELEQEGKDKIKIIKDFEKQRLQIYKKTGFSIDHTSKNLRLGIVERMIHYHADKRDTYEEAVSMLKNLRKEKSN